jgi:hypothetical protein
VCALRTGIESQRLDDQGKENMTQIPKMCAALVVFAFAAAARPVPAAAATGRYKTSAGTVLDTKTKLTWQQSVASSRMTWAAAKSYCASLGSTLGGNGWRLPTIKELQTLVDVSVSPGPAIDVTAFPDMPASSGFWSSTPATASPSVAWVLIFSDGSEGQAGVSQTFLVRCVR